MPATSSSKPNRIRKALGRALLLGSAAGLAYGLWALAANWPHGIAVAVRAALAQFLVSFASTLFMVLILERLFTLGRSPGEGFVTAATGTTLISASLMATTHALAGTPSILLTIAPLVAVAAFVYTGYAWGLRVAALREGRRS